MIENESFSRQERAAISQEFRAEITQHGIGNAILTVLCSKSNKTPIRRQVLAQQCRKQSFCQNFGRVCEGLARSNPELRPQVIDLHLDITGKQIPFK